MFEALTGHRPFGWQQRLFDEWLSLGKLPSTVDIPTGLGKTAVMALWLIARAAGADLPRRLVYVVDRRAVVDQATRFAEQLRANMPGALATELGLKNGPDALPISTLRGSFADNRDWLEDPVKPAIIVGTIDMIGSRLLFQGYGVTRNMRPFHAGFLGVDTVVLLDEAHLCPPFEALLRCIANHRDGQFGEKLRGGAVAPPFRLISLSATGREVAEMSSESVFRLNGRDLEEPIVHQRLTARKRLSMMELTDAGSLTERMANRAVELSAGEVPSRVVVYCDRRTDAVEVKRLIDGEFKRRQKVGELAKGWESELLVGERRVHERTELEKWLERNGFLGDSPARALAPTLLAATSAGEVGVDLDADHMVCDLVAWERMVQRLGRVNRRGGGERTATVDVFAVRPDLKPNAGKAEQEKHESLLGMYQRRLAPLRQLPFIEGSRREASPSATTELKRDYPDVVNAATTPAPLHPALTRPLVDAWAMTSLNRHEGRPEVAPWLRGWDEDDDPQTDVVWRKHLPLVRTDDGVSAPPLMTAEFFSSAPIHATERLEAPSSRVLEWLLKRAAQIGRRSQDHEAAIRDEEMIVAILLDRTGEQQMSASLGELRRLAATAGSMSKQRNRSREKREWRERHLPGAVLILDARIGGLRDGMLDEKCEIEATAADSDEDWRAEDRSAEPPRPAIRFRVEVTDDEGGEGLGVSELGDWRHVRTFETCLDAGGVPRHGLAVYKWPDDPADEDSRSILSAPQTLSDHAEEAATRARNLAKGLGLPGAEVEALTMAARLHDDGKAADRWQNAMNAPKDGRPYAKTGGGGNWRLLERYRHEFGSLLKAERADLPDRTRDLILHLIAAHHGNARPLIRVDGCEDGPPSLLESKAGDAALRFARLQKQYGPWGLAWREAILRAADQGVSREWNRRQEKQANG